MSLRMELSNVARKSHIRAKKPSIFFSSNILNCITIRVNKKVCTCPTKKPKIINEIMVLNFSGSCGFPCREIIFIIRRRLLLSKNTRPISFQKTSGRRDQCRGSGDSNCS
jgi:hypothetical protein